MNRDTIRPERERGSLQRLDPDREERGKGSRQKRLPACGVVCVNARADIGPKEYLITKECRYRNPRTGDCYGKHKP
jgi:hypothetical protein